MDSDDDGLKINNRDESGSRETGDEITPDQTIAQLDAFENGDEDIPFFQYLFGLLQTAYNAVIDENQCGTDSCGSESLEYQPGEEAGLRTPSDNGNEEVSQTESSPGSDMSDMTTTSQIRAVASLDHVPPSAQKESYISLAQTSGLQSRQLFRASPPQSDYRRSTTSIASVKSIQQNSIADLVSTADTSMISEFLTEGLKKKEGDDLLEYFSEHRTGGVEVVKLIARCMYKKDVALDVRKAMSPESSVEKEMQVILGKAAAAYARSRNSKCYLCGGTLTGEKIDRRGTQTRIDEVDHKVPCKTFYALFRVVKREFPDEYSAWIGYINSDDIKYKTFKKTYADRLEYVYSIINNSSTLNQDTLDAAFELVESGFQTYLVMNPISSLENMDGFFRTMRSYLLEFAYTHHVCNRVKSDNDLSDDDILKEYFKTLINIAESKNINSWKDEEKMTRRPDNYRIPACLDQDIANTEFDQIRSGLGSSNSKKSWAPNRQTLENRKNLVKLEIDNIMQNGRINAVASNSSMKRSMIRTIREIVSMQNIKVSDTNQIALQANALKSILKRDGERFKAANKFGVVMSKKLYIATGSRGMGLSATKQLRAKILDDWDTFENMVSDSYDLPTELNNINRHKSKIKADVINAICECAQEYVAKLIFINNKMQVRFDVSEYTTLLTREDIFDINTTWGEIKEQLGAITQSINALCPDNRKVGASVSAPTTDMLLQSFTEPSSSIMSIDDLANNIFNAHQDIMNKVVTDRERDPIMVILHERINSSESSEDIANSIVSQYTYGKFTNKKEINEHNKSVNSEKNVVRDIINAFRLQFTAQLTPEKSSSGPGTKKQRVTGEEDDLEDNDADLFSFWSNSLRGGSRKSTTRKRRPSKKLRRTIRRQRRNKKGTQKRRK